MSPTSAQGFQARGWGPPLLCLSPRHPQGELEAVGCLTRGKLRPSGATAAPRFPRPLPSWGQDPWGGQSEPAPPPVPRAAGLPPGVGCAPSGTSSPNSQQPGRTQLVLKIRLKPHP